MNLPVQHNGALGAFCPCETCTAFLGELSQPIENSTPSHARDPLEQAMVEGGLLSAEGYLGSFSPNAAALGHPDEAYEAPLTVAADERWCGVSLQTGRAPAQVIDIDEARQRAMPAADPLADDGFSGAFRPSFLPPVHLGDFRGQVAPGPQVPTGDQYRRNRRRQLAVQLVGWAIVASVLYLAVRS